MRLTRTLYAGVLLVMMLIVTLLEEGCRFSPESHPTIDIDRIRRCASTGASYLATIQDDDGSWNSLMSADRFFTDPVVSAPRIFPAMTILFNLMHTPFTCEPFYDKGIRYLENNREPLLPLWSLMGSDPHSNTEWKASLPFTIPPDCESTSLGLILLRDRMEVETDTLEKIFELYRGPDGLYKTYFTGYSRPVFDIPGFINHPSLGSNINVLIYRHIYSLPCDSLLDAVTRILSGDDFMEKDIYFKSYPVLCLYLSNLAEHGFSRAIPLLEQCMERFGEICLPEEAGTLSDIELAAYIKAKSTLLMQLKSSGSENGLALLATELCRRQANDGSWKAGPVYQANYFDNNPEAGSRLLFFGSPAETTAIAVKALITFVQYRESVN